VVLTFCTLIASIASFSIIPSQFFPTSNRPEILVDLWLPEGSAFEETERQARRLEQQLSKDPNLAYIATFIGEGAPRFYLPLDQQLRNQNFAQLLLMSNSIEARERVIVEVREILAREFPNVRFKADRLFNGPPVGWPVQLRVTGPDRNEVRRLAAEVGDVMRATPEVSNVHNDWLEPVPSLKLEIDQDRARALGVTSQGVRRSLQAMLSGFQIGEFRDKDETIKVMLREPSDTRHLLSALDNVFGRTPVRHRFGNERKPSISCEFPGKFNFGGKLSRLLFRQFNRASRLRIRLQSLDFPARTIFSRSSPSNVRTK
jgi:multidrug efflux pump